MTARFLWLLIRPYRLGLALLMLVYLAESAVSLALPAVAGRFGSLFLDATLAKQSLWPVILAIAALLVCQAVFSTLSSLLFAQSSETILSDLRQRLFDHLLALPVAWHHRQSRGNLMALTTFELERLGYFITHTLVSLVPLVLTAFGASVALFLIDPALALLIPILIPVIIISTRLLGRLLRGLARRIQSEHAEATARVEEMLDLLPALKSFAVERDERRRHAGGLARLKLLSLREARILAFLNPVTQLVTSLLALTLLLLAGQRLRADELTVAGALTFLMYVAVMVRPLTSLASVYGEVQTARGTLARLQDVLETPVEPSGLPHSPSRRFSGKIQFEKLSFAYPERGAAVDGLDLTVEPGQIVALTGPNGAGKSTAISLLLAFLKPDAGRILLDGIDIATLPPQEVRQAIGLVPQTRHLRNASVRDNIVFGREGFTAEAVEAAARIAQAHAFIQTLPEGYDTVIGERGLRLSGGQQQRIALARALLGNPAVLILDEATSMYDLEGEAAFVADCREALVGRTVLLITHRPASLALADRIVRMENGRLVCKEHQP